jgi:hypothetical protein
MATTMIAPTTMSVELARPRWTRRAWFWVRRYGPAELACLITMLAASIGAARVTDSPPLLAVAAIAGATVGFYGVLLTAVLREQSALLAGQPRRVRRACVRTVGLLAAEFGVAEIADTFFLRPALMILGVILVGDAVWGLLLGKIVADVLFYVISGACFRLTQRSGIRLPRVRRRIVVENLSSAAG